MSSKETHPHNWITAMMAVDLAGMKGIDDITAFQCGVLTTLHLVQLEPEYAMALLAGIEQEFEPMSDEVAAEFREWVQLYPLKAVVV